MYMYIIALLLVKIARALSVFNIFQEAFMANGAKSVLGKKMLSAAFLNAKFSHL